MISAPNRLDLLARQGTITGLDFVHVDAGQRELYVHFLSNLGASNAAPLSGLRPDQVSITPIEGSGGARVDVTAIGWDGAVLQITVRSPGGGSLYSLQIDDSRVDAYYNSLEFSFRAGCPSGLDCICREQDLPDEVDVDFLVDYRARDFWSFRQALLDFASFRYPGWEERLEADAAMMLVEAMSSLGDEFAYYQDRVAREGFLETATQRRSVRRHALLVDYPMHDGRGATGWLDIQVSAGADEKLELGTDVWSRSSDGSDIHFEVGRGLNDVDRDGYAVNAASNEFRSYVWHENDTCLPVGATELYVSGSHKGDLDFNDPPEDLDGRWVLLKSTPEDPAIPTRTHIVRLTSVEDGCDPLVDKEPYTRLGWEREQALPFEMELASLVVRGNLIPISAGRTVTERFTIGESDSPDDRPSAIERQGRGIGREECGCGSADCVQEGVQRRGVEYLYTLAESNDRGLARLGEEIHRTRPEIKLIEVEAVDGVWEDATEWEFRDSLIGGNPSSQSGDQHFTLDDGTWERVVSYQRISRRIDHFDYASGDGTSIRFGDGEFGRVPEIGTVFQVTYRVGNGIIGNVPADTVTGIDKSDGSLDFVESLTNPLATTGGVEPQSADEARRLAPEAYRALTYRSVRPNDYEEAAERLDWVQRAGATLRWTGSALTMFVTPDPRGAVTVSESQLVEARRQLDRFRQAGRETHVRPPRYADIDLTITVIADADSFAGEVKEAVLTALVGQGNSRRFFSPDRFTFGGALERSQLEAAIQRVPGVAVVSVIEIGRRGWFAPRLFTEFALEVGAEELVRVENDLNYPDRGTVRLIMEGGR